MPDTTLFDAAATAHPPLQADAGEAATRLALRDAVAQLDEAETRALPFEMSQALARVARCYCELGSFATAEGHSEQALRWARLAGSTDLVVDRLCELAETSVTVAMEARRRDGDGSARRAALDRARDRAFEVAVEAGRVSDPRWEVTVLFRIADVLDRCRDTDDATALRQRALRLLGGTAPGRLNPALLPAPARLADG